MTIAVLDACVLYSALLRDLFMRLTVGLAFQPKWTPHIHAEWMRNVLENRPDVKPEALERTRALMDQWGQDWEAPGYEAFIDTLTLPDGEDRHALAAGIASGASLIVTFNLSDFPQQALEAYGIRAVHPDAFVCELLDEREALCLGALRIHRASLKNPSKTVAEYLASLRQHGLPQTAERLERSAAEI